MRAQVLYIKKKGGAQLTSTKYNNNNNNNAAQSIYQAVYLLHNYI